MQTKFKAERRLTKESCDAFVKSIEHRKNTDFKQRFAECKKLKKLSKKRNFKEAKAISEKHNYLYSKVPKETGSSNIFMPSSKYTIFVDEDLRDDDAIDLRSQTVERFYEALDELDQYDLGLPDNANFFVLEIKDKNSKLEVERASQRESFLDREKWKVVNPTVKLFASSETKKIKLSPKSKSKRLKI